jgi:hypothetical protein
MIALFKAIVTILKTLKVFSVIKILSKHGFPANSDIVLPKRPLGSAFAREVE